MFKKYIRSPHPHNISGNFQDTWNDHHIYQHYISLDFLIQIFMKGRSESPYSYEQETFWVQHDARKLHEYKPHI